MKNKSINMVFPVPTSPDNSSPSGVSSAYISSSRIECAQAKVTVVAVSTTAFPTVNAPKSARLPIHALQIISLTSLVSALRIVLSGNNPGVVSKVSGVYGQFRRRKNVLDCRTKLCLIGFEYVAFDEVLVDNEGIGDCKLLS